MTPRTKEAQRFGNRWCHLWTDSENVEELHQFAEQLFKPVHPRIVRRWFQGPPDHAPHYDITEKKRPRAIQLGAREMTTAERLQRERELFVSDQAWSLPTLDDKKELDFHA